MSGTEALVLIGAFLGAFAGVFVGWAIYLAAKRWLWPIR